MAWSGIVTILALLLSMFPQVAGLPVPAAEAHNLQTRMVYMFFDPDTQACLDARIAGTPLPAGCAPLPTGWAPGDPLLQPGDEVGVIIKVVPRDGTTTGVGGHIDFYIPNGVQVTDVGYVVPNGAGGYDKVAMKGQSPIAIGAGPVGPKTTAQLIGLTDIYTSTASGLSSTAVNPATGLHLGTIAGVYGDTGIFFSTDPDTVYGSWQTYNGASTANGCGSLAFNPTALGPTLVNNSGDTVVPCNKWDAEQLLAWGVKGGTFGQSAPIVDYGDGRGNAPWGFASGVAGPQSGYAWHFDWDQWQASGKTAADMRAAMANTKIGPWQRIQYPGSRVSYDQPGLISSVLGYASKDAGNLGVPVSTLPTTVSQTDTTSPKAIRWAVGQLTAYRPEYAWVKVKVTDATAGITNPSGCPDLRGDTFGGDAGGTDNGKDHLWRYYEPTEVKMGLCAAVGKPATKEFVQSGTFFQYPIKIYNLQDFPLTNVVVKDTLGSGLSFVSAVPAQNSGPNPLVWNVGTLLPGQKFEATVTVKATSTGYLDNCVVLQSDQLTESSCDTTISGLYPYLVPSKSARSSSVAPGGTVIYDVLVKNIGTGPTGNPVTIREFLPAGFTYDASYTPVVTVNGALVTATVNATNPNEPIFTVPAAIQGGKQLTIAFRAVVSPAAEPGLYCNSYSVTQNGVPITTGSEACVSVAGGKIGDTIWRDWDGNGVQDPGEEGIAGVTVKLYASDGTTLLATTTTDADGHYYFPGLTAGTYVVEVNNGAALPGTVQTGDPDATLDNKHTVNLATDQQYLTADFGYKPTGSGSIGDKVFEDIGNDGSFDAGADFGIPNVTVWLYEDSNNNGVIDAGDALVATTQSDSNGDYLFSNLATGFNYLVKVDKTDADIQTYFDTKYGSGTPYQLSTPEMTSSPNLTGADLDNDFGFWRVLPGSIGDQVFIDNNGNGVYDAGDTPLAGITVTLLRDGQPFATTVSGPDGTYLFDNLGPGNYTVIVDTADPDLPAGLFATVTQYEKSLAAGENHLTADFPFVSGLTKTANKTYAMTGETVQFSIKPFYPGTALLENVRVFDPLPTGTTYVGGSANAGGTFGPYSPLPAVPGQDTDGGPSGGVTLDTAISVNTSFVNTGGSVNVTLNVKQNSGSTVNNVSPTDLVIEGGSASCTGPTPSSANVPSGAVGSNFVWACTLTSAGEYVFVAAAENDTGSYIWPEASSASVLSAPTGGPNVVTWNLGSNAPGVPGETLTSGYTAGIYAFRGANTKEFSKYSITSNAWASRAQPTNGIEKGGSLTTDGAGTIYALEGNSKIFYKYNIATNTWSTLPATSDNVNEGGAVQYLKVGSTEYVFALLGGSNRFRRYTVGGSWANAVNTPANVKKGGALTTDGTYIYALRGDRQKSFWRCNATVDGAAGSCFGTGGSWTALADAPANVGWGGALTRIGNYIYAFRGDGKPDFWRYDITANSWSVMAKAPGNVGDGGALTTDGTYVYALQGKTKAFWRYNPATNTWTTLASTNFLGNVGQGGALVYEPGSTPVGRFTAMSATPSLVSTGNQITVRLRLESSTAVNNVTAGTLTVIPSGGASCSAITGPTLLSADDDIADINDPVLYQWICTVTAGANPGSLTFSAGGTGDGPTTFPTAQSRSVLVSPVLTFQVTVNAGAPVVIENAAVMAETGGGFGSISSNTTGTATTASIGDYVWNDADADGIQDGNELGLAGVKVYVDSNGNGQWDAGEPYDITDAVGLYRIYGLGVGTYTVRTDPSTYPAGYFPTTASSLSVTLTAGQQYNDADFGLATGTGVIGDTVWLDANNNGSLDGAEQGLPGIIVKLYRDLTGNGLTPDDPLLATDTTDADGNYLFEGLPAGNYLVVVDEANSNVTSPYDGNSYTLAAAMDPVFGTNLASVSLSAGQSHLTADFPYNWAGSIGDFVWWDDNTNGLQDESPLVGIPNAAVLLYFDANNNGILDPAEGDYQVGFAMTDASGNYLFDNLPPGRYLVDVYEDSITTDGNRNIVPTTANVLYVNLGAGETYLAADFGYYEGALVQGYVFHDDDRNGLFETHENGLQGITVTLTGTDMFGNPITQTTTTDAAGYFVFIVPEGDYTLTYSTAQTTAAGYPDATTVTSFEFHAYPGENWYEQTVFDFGVDYSGVVGDRVWNDANGDGVQDPGEPGLAGVTVNLYASDGTTWLAATVTDANGNYLFEGLADGTYVVKVEPATLPTDFGQTYDNSGPLDDTGVATVSGGGSDLTADFGYRYAPAGGASLYTISGRVYNDLNNNGNDDGEPGFAGVDVTVVCDFGTFVVQTDGTGAWALAGIPDGSACTVLDADETDLPRRDYVATETPGTPITVNSNITGLDFGYNQQPGSISGTVCEGTGNGICEPGEAPIAGVTVTLTWFGPDGILGTPDDAVITTTTTITGFYSFTDLQPGLYQLVQTNLPGYTSVADADGGNPDVISPVILPLGGAVTGQDFEDAPPPSVAVSKELTTPVSGVAAISDTITFTIRITNTGITALPTLTITDTYDAGVLTLISHSIVPDLTAPGLITWTNSLAPFLPLLPGQALTIAVDFHADVSTYPDVTENVVRVTGEDVFGVPIEPQTATAEAQIINPVIGLAKDLYDVSNNGDGTYTVVYRLLVENLGDVPLSNVQVTDDLSQTFVGSGGFVVDGLTTSANLTPSGGYTGTPPNINLLAGTDTLTVGASGLITLTVTVTPTTKLGVYENQAEATGTAPGDIVVSDLSQDGAEADPDNDGDPTNNDDPTPVTFTENPAIGVAKEATQVVNNGDGTYVVTFTLTVQNYGDVILHNLVITDDIVTQFAGLSPTGFQAISGTLNANPTWNGTAGSNILAAGQSLAVGASGTVQIRFTVTPGAAQTVNNTAYARGVSPAGTAVTDQSQDGLDPDPGTPPDGDPTNNNEPTPVQFAENPVIGIAKAVQSVDNLGGGQYRVTYLLTVRNYGNVNLYNVQVTDNLATTFSGATSWSVESVTSADFSVNPGYTGTPPNTGLLLGTDTLAVGGSGTITLKVLVTPGGNLGPYNNTAVATGDSPFGTPVNDLSQNGTNPDPDGDNNPGNNNVPTPVTFTARTQIGVAKAVSQVVNNGDGTYDVTYSILVANMGDTVLNNVQVTDNLDNTFGAGKHAVQSVSSTTFAVNPGYTGAPPNTSLLLGTDTLNPGASGIITLVVRVTPGSNLGPYNNRATGTATGPGGVPTADNSQNGTNPDPDGDGDPTNNNQLTPVSFTEAPAIGIAKAVASATNNGDGTFTVAYTLTVRNYGDVVLNNVQVTDNLAATFPAPATFSVVGVTSTGFTVNPGYNGSSDINLLTATGNTLAVGQTKTIVLTVTVTPVSSPATYNNQATATGVSPAGAQVSDLSHVGLNPDLDGDNNPGNNGDPTPVTLTQTPGIQVVKTGPAASYVGGTAVYTYTVTNTGDVRLGTVTVADDVCGNAAYVSGDTNTDGYLDPNETWLFTCSYVVQANDPDPLVNIATATGVGPLGQQVSDTDDWSVDLVTFTIGDRVWLDTNGNGSQDPGETAGFYNVPIVITGTDVDGGSVNLTVYTDINGYYLATLAKPGTYTVTAPLSFGGYAPSTPTSQSVTLTVAAPSYLDADFGYVMPTGLYIIGPEAAVDGQNQVRVSWQATLPEGMEAPAFHVWRATADGRWKQLTAERVAASSFDGVIYGYAYTDGTVQRGTTYLYRIEASDGVTYGPCQITIPGIRRVFLPLVLR